MKCSVMVFKLEFAGAHYTYDLFANSAMARDYENRRESKQGEQVVLKLNPFGDEWMPL